MFSIKSTGKLYIEDNAKKCKIVIYTKKSILFIGLLFQLIL
jgi:ribosomal protein S3